MLQSFDQNVRNNPKMDFYFELVSMESARNGITMAYATLEQASRIELRFS